MPELIRRTTSVLDGIPGGPHEIVFVDDGSSDRTLQLLEEAADGDEKIVVVELSRNFGHQTALAAALDHVSGDVAILIDGDLQDPPEATHATGVVLPRIRCGLRPAHGSQGVLVATQLILPFLPVARRKHHLNHFTHHSLKRLLEEKELRTVQVQRHNTPMAAVDTPKTSRLSNVILKTGVWASFQLGMLTRRTMLQTIISEKVDSKNHARGTRGEMQ